MTTVQKLCGEREIEDVIKIVRPHEDNFEDDDGYIHDHEDEEPKPLDFDDDGFERGYN